MIWPCPDRLSKALIGALVGGVFGFFATLTALIGPSPKEIFSNWRLGQYSWHSDVRQGLRGIQKHYQLYWDCVGLYDWPKTKECHCKNLNELKMTLAQIEKAVEWVPDLVD